MTVGDPRGGAGGYLDAASAEPLHPAALEAWQSAVGSGFADPRRVHGPGRVARILLDNAREATAEAFGVRADEVVFTASGTAAVHRGLLGLHKGRSRAGRSIVSSAVEHAAVRHAIAWTGAAAHTVPVDRLGRVDADEVAAAVADTEPTVVAVQSANHEVGTVQPIAEIAHRLGDIPLFMDACASAGRLPLPDRWAAAAASAHKWGGPAGVGVLLLRRNARWRDPFPGDERVDHRVSGFENVPGVFAAAAALQAVVAEREHENRRQHDLISRLRSRIAATVPDVEIVGDPDDRLPHIVTFSCLYLDGEALVTELDRHGFGVASGSACAASDLTPSPVLAAMGVLTHGNVRLSVTRLTTSDDVDRFAEVLPGIVADLRGKVGM